jgi:hypothetical protein
MAGENKDIKWSWNVNLVGFGRSSYVVVPPELRNFKKWVYKQKLVLLLMEDGTLRLEDRKEVDRND